MRGRLPGKSGAAASSGPKGGKASQPVLVGRLGSGTGASGGVGAVGPPGVGVAGPRSPPVVGPRLRGPQMSGSGLRSSGGGGGGVAVFGNRGCPVKTGPRFSGGPGGGPGGVGGTYGWPGVVGPPGFPGGGGGGLPLPGPGVVGPPGVPVLPRPPPPGVVGGGNLSSPPPPLNCGTSAHHRHMPWRLPLIHGCFRDASQDRCTGDFRGK